MSEANDHWQSTPAKLDEFIRLRTPQEQIYLAHNQPATTGTANHKLPLGAQHILKVIRDARRAAKDEDGQPEPIDLKADTLSWLSASPAPQPSP